MKLILRCSSLRSVAICFSFFRAHPRSLKLVEDRRKVNRDKAIGFHELDDLTKEVMRIYHGYVERGNRCIRRPSGIPRLFGKPVAVERDQCDYI
jgi:hypothetical protein